jgi:quinol monooxygenase YgiN
LGDHLKHGLFQEVHAEMDSMRRNSTLMDTFRFESSKGPGIKIVIHTVYTLKSGKTDEFKTIVGKLVEAVRTHEKSSSSGYMFSTTDTASVAVNFSFYESESAALAHIRNGAVNQLIPELEAICDDIHMNVYGKMDERTRKAFGTFVSLNDFHVKTTLHSPIDSTK